MLLCGMNFINLIRIQFIFGIEDQLILSYNPIPSYGSYVLRGHSDISQGVFRVSYIPAGRFAGDGGVQLVLGAALFFSVPDPAL